MKVQWGLDPHYLWAVAITMAKKDINNLRWLLRDCLFETEHHQEMERRQRESKRPNGCNSPVWVKLKTRSQELHRGLTCGRQGGHTVGPSSTIFPGSWLKLVFDATIAGIGLTCCSTTLASKVVIFHSTFSFFWKCFYINARWNLFFAIEEETNDGAGVLASA